MASHDREPRRVESVYQTRVGASEMLLYGGPVEVETASKREVIDG